MFNLFFGLLVFLLRYVLPVLRCLGFCVDTTASVDAEAGHLAMAAADEEL